MKVYNEYVAGLDTSIISSFPEEKEVLFFGNKSILQISSIFQWYNKIWTNYKKYINGIQNLLNIANGSIKWHHINNMKDIIGYLLPHLYYDNKQLPPYIVSLLDYHLTHLPNVIEYDYRELSRHYQWVQDIFVKQSFIPNIPNACNLFTQCDRITIIMSNDHTMNAECCQSIVEDIVNIKNDNIAIEFRWKSPVPLNDIKITFEKIAVKSKNSILQTEVNEMRNSIYIYPSSRKMVPQNIQYQSYCSFEVDEEYKLVIYGFIREFVQKHIFIYPIPSAIIEICCRFYAYYFVPLPDHITPTPFTLLFAVFQMQTGWSIKEWNIEDISIQCEYLQDDEINTPQKRESVASELFSETNRMYKLIILMLSKYYKDSQYLKHTETKNIAKWSGEDIILSFISELIEAFAEDTIEYKKKTKKYGKMCEFIHYMRKYIDDTKYEVSTILADVINHKSWFGLQLIKNVCQKYALKTGQFTESKSRLTIWAIKIYMAYKGVEQYKKVKIYLFISAM